MQPDSWPAIEAEIERIIRVTVEEPFDRDTIANAHELLRFARERCPIPSINKGKWSTICFSWDHPALEVEVFGNRFEVYRFYDRRTDIKEVRHTPGNTFPQGLAAELPSRD
jgi:hypothetical protein